MRLLIAEDERELARALEAILKHNNYLVDVVGNGQDAYDYACAENYDGILLDIMMPKMNGFQVLEKLRADGVQTPVMMLTAKSETEDKIEGLDRGADDYLTKPFDMGELLARVRALTRRRGDVAPAISASGNLSLNMTTYILAAPAGEIRLSNREFQMMELFLLNKGNVISTQTFMEKIWGYDTDAEINVVWVYVSNLRKKLAQIGSNVEIKAVRGVGYYLEAK